MSGAARTAPVPHLAGRRLPLAPGCPRPSLPLTPLTHMQLSGSVSCPVPGAYPVVRVLWSMGSSVGPTTGTVAGLAPPVRVPPSGSSGDSAVRGGPGFGRGSGLTCGMSPPTNSTGRREARAGATPCGAPGEGKECVG